jgi:hypothetical protein
MALARWLLSDTGVRIATFRCAAPGSPMSGASWWAAQATGMFKAASELGPELAFGGHFVGGSDVHRGPKLELCCHAAGRAGYR